jgi:hypothetical protein
MRRKGHIRSGGVSQILIEDQVAQNRSNRTRVEFATHTPARCVEHRGNRRWAMQRIAPHSRNASNAPGMLRLAAALWLLLTAQPTFAQGLDLGFESLEPSWRFMDAAANYRVEVHQRTSEDPHGGAGCEVVRIASGNGRFIHLALDIPPAHVIAELQPSVWVRSSRPGVQLLVRVVFPRTADEKGKPLTRLVAGSTGKQQGTWEQLRIAQLPKLVEAIVRPMRAQYGSHIDVREAYVDRLVLNLYCGPGTVQVAIDDVELPNLIAVEERTARPSTPPAASGGPPRRRVELVGSILMVDARPFFPRIIDYQKESLSFLKELGFNVVRLPTTPSEALLDEAQRAGMWLICPPPPIQKNEEGDPLPFDNRYEPVLAWHLGQGLTGRELDAMREWVEHLRRADEEADRPLICDPADELAQYARLLAADGILMFHRSLLGATFEVADFTTWLRTRPRLGMPGMPVWAAIETQYSKELSDQISLLSSGRAPEPAAEFEQLRLLVQAALAAGVRGLAFTSRTPLDGQDTATRVRARTLALINLELKIIQQHLAAGRIDTEIRAADAEGTNPGITGATVQLSHTRLLLPLWAGTGAQYVPDQLAGNMITFVAAGAP